MSVKLSASTNPVSRSILSHVEQVEVVLVFNEEHAFLRDVAERKKAQLSEALTAESGAKVTVIGARVEACSCRCHHR